MNCYHPILIAASLLCSAAAVRGAVTPDPAVLKAEDERAEAIAKASAATVAVFDGSGGGGGIENPRVAVPIDGGIESGPRVGCSLIRRLRSREACESHG